MPYVIDPVSWTSDLAEYHDDSFKITDAHIQMIHQMFARIAAGLRIDSYSEYFPDIDWAAGYWRRIVGESLYLVWSKCSCMDIPRFNFMVVSKNFGLPGNGIKAFYLNTFGTMDGYRDFCLLRANECVRALNSGLVVVKNDNLPVIHHTIQAP